MYAVVSTGGKQYRVAAGDKIAVEKLAGEAGDTITLGDVLLAGEGETLADAKSVTVSAEIIAQAKSETASLRIDEAKILDAIDLEAREAVNAVKEAGEIVKAMSGTVSQAERLLALAEKGFEFGVKTRLEVEDAVLNLQQARGNLAKARRDYLVARVNQEFAKGTIDDGARKPEPEEKEWRPAESIPGVFKEVILLQPRLNRPREGAD